MTTTTEARATRRRQRGERRGGRRNGGGTVYQRQAPAGVRWDVELRDEQGERSLNTWRAHESDVRMHMGPAL